MEIKENIMLREIPREERPRERLIKNGPQSLATYELLAIILRTGYKKNSVLDVSKNLLSRFSDLNELSEATIQELKTVPGIGEAKAVELLAAIELGKRINIPKRSQISLTNPNNVYNFVKEKLQNLNQEYLVALYLNSKSELIQMRTISVGAVNLTVFDIKNILKWGLKYSSTAIILVHNHPSGDPTPSRQDINATKDIIKAAATVDLSVVDHLIVGKGSYYSFLEKGMMRSL